MALLPIVLWPDPILLQRATEVTEFDSDLHQLLQDLTQTMWVEDGVGLAAPQVGIGKRIFITTEVLHSKATALEVINPEIIEMEGREVRHEACLSLEGMSFDSVPRATEILVAFQDRNGEKRKKLFTGFEARAFQHELDHLNGVLLIDELLKKYPEPFRRERWAKQIRDSYDFKIELRRRHENRRQNR